MATLDYRLSPGKRRERETSIKRGYNKQAEKAAADV